MARARFNAFMIAGLLASGCSSPVASRTPAEQIKMESRVLFSYRRLPAGTPDGYHDAFLWSGLERFKDASADARLRAECVDAPRVPVSGFLAFLVGPLVSLFTDSVKTSLDEALKKYSADFKVAEQTRFWDRTDAGATPAWRCFRVIRMRTTTQLDASGQPLKVSRSIDFDFIGQVAVVGASDVEAGTADGTAKAYGIKVRPLRVYLAQPLAKGSEVAMSANVTFDAVWRDGPVGKKETVLVAPVLEKKFKRTPARRSRDGTGTWSERPLLFSDVKDGVEDPNAFPSWSRYPLLPIVPWGEAAGPAGTMVNVTFAAAEVGAGDGKGTLTAIRKLFGAAQSDINTLLTKAGKKLVDPAAPTPPAKPDAFCGVFTPKADGSIIGEWTKTDDSCPTS